MSNIVYGAVMVLVAFFQTIFFCLLGYKNKNIPDYKVGIIEHNLESTPIYDILSGNQCEDYNKTSNILGYYFGYDEGFECDRKSHTKDDKSVVYDSDDCSEFDANRTLIE